MTAVTWSPEPAAPPGELQGFAPEGVWALRYGRDFDVTATAPRRDPRDYGWQIVLETRAGRTQAALTVAEVGKDAFAPLSQAQDGDGPPAEAIEVVPLRAGDTGRRACCAAAWLAPLPEIAAPAASDPLPDTDSAAGPDDAPPGDGSDAPAHVERARFRAPLRADAIAAGPLTRPAYARQGLSPDRAAIVGIVDDAINPLHDRFRLADGGTRVDFFWAQDARATASGPVPFGRAWDRAALENVLDGPATISAGQLQRLGLLDPSRGGPAPLSRRAGHGTHVADLAAGFAPADAPRDARIVAVSLPALVTRDTSGGTLAPFLITALDHILDRAAQMSAAEGFPIPVFVNFSYALSGGPQNGLHLIETAIDALVAAHEARMARAFAKLARPDPLVEVILPSGNAALARLNAATDPAPGPGRATLAVDWRINPGDVTQNLLELWLPRAARDVTLRIGAPGQAACLLDGLAPGRAMLLHPEGAPGRVIGRAAMTVQAGDAGDGYGPRLRRVLIALAPTARPTGLTGPTAPSGRWRIEVAAEVAAGGQLRARVLRDEAPAGHARPGRASWLEHDAYRLHDGTGQPATQDVPGCPVRRAGTLSGIATGRAVRVIGGWRGPEATPPGPHPAPYAGAAADWTGAVDASAQCDRSRALRGVPAAGTASGSVVAMNGTSVAAPQYLRLRLLERLGRDAPAPVELPQADPQLGRRRLPPLRRTGEVPPAEAPLAPRDEA